MNRHGNTVYTVWQVLRTVAVPHFLSVFQLQGEVTLPQELQEVGFRCRI